MKKNLFPNGKCWCGCGADVSRRSYFKPGHDRKAESSVIEMEYGGVVEFLVEHGYGPDGKNVFETYNEFIKK